MRIFSRFPKSPNNTISVAAMLIGSALVVAIVMTYISPASAQTPFGAAKDVSGFAGWVLSKQAIFYRALSGTILAAKNDGSALWTLMGISFVYGVFHAAGPGHGKAVISSYLLANDETWRRGVTLSFASALVQSLTAVLIVGIAAVLLGGTAKMMGQAVRVIELTSYSLIVVLGARLLWVKGLGFFRAVAAVRSVANDNGLHHHAIDVQDCTHHRHAHGEGACDKDHSGLFRRNHLHSAVHCVACDQDHSHGHDHEPNVLPWGHAHGPEPQALAGPGGWKRGLSAIVAVGLRPCSGAIILLVFALSQGLLWAGVVSAFVMGLGTAITVAAIATLAVSAKAFVQRFTVNRIGYGGVLVRGLEAGAAVLIMAFGFMLLAGYMASERLVGF
jgi:nickel/cobalt transporter (NicO) family protein